MNSIYAGNTLITDSAAAGTALASSVKTDSGVVGKTPNGENVKTLIEAAKVHGMATGIISRTRLTHTIPAAFAAHNISRDNENEITEDFVTSHVDFLAGGRIRHFIPKSMVVENGDAVGKTIKFKRKDKKIWCLNLKNKGIKLSEALSKI